MLPIIHLFIHLTGKQKKQNQLLSAPSVWHQLEKRLKMRIDDSLNKKLF